MIWKICILRFLKCWLYFKILEIIVSPGLKLMGGLGFQLTHDIMFPFQLGGGGAISLEYSTGQICLV